MQAIAMALPVLPGKENAARMFAQEAQGPRKRELEATAKKLGIHHEEWFLQRTPTGSELVGFMEADDIGRAFEKAAQDKSEFISWYRDQVRNITGVDIHRNPPADPERLFNYHV